MNYICKLANQFPRCGGCGHSKLHDVEEEKPDGCDKTSWCPIANEDCKCVKTEEK